METKRQRQIAGLVQRAMSEVLREQGAFIYGSEPLVTITRVRMTADLGVARIYVSIYNVEYKQEVVKEMWENIYRLRRELGNRLARQVRRIPRIEFYIDDTLDQVEHLDRLFEDMKGGNSNQSMKDALDS